MPLPGPSTATFDPLDQTSRFADLLRSGSTPPSPPPHKENATTSEVTHYVSAGGAALRLVNGTAEFTHLDTQGSPVAGRFGVRLAFALYGQPARYWNAIQTHANCGSRR